MSLLVPVLVEGWQYECCGQAPVVGQRVAWRLTLRGPEAADLPGVDLAVDLEPLPAPLVEEWQALGNPTGPAPALARHGGLTVFLHDVAAARGGRLRGLLQEDHHVDVPSDVPATTGTVTRVWLVSRQLRHQGVRRVVAVAGTAELDEVEAAPSWLPHEPPPDGALLWRETSEVLVELRVDPT